MATADDVKRLCLALPEAWEQHYHGVPTFRVAGRKFASLHRVGASHFSDLDFRVPAIVVKLDREDQRGLIEARPDVILPHRYHARYGWAVVVLLQVDEALLGLLLRMAWASVAPKRLLRSVGPPARFGGVGSAAPTQATPPAPAARGKSR